MKPQGYRWGLEDWLADPELETRDWRFSFEKPWRPCLHVGAPESCPVIRCDQINTDRIGVSDHTIAPKGRGTSTKKISNTKKT